MPKCLVTAATTCIAAASATAAAVASSAAQYKQPTQELQPHHKCVQVHYKCVQQLPSTSYHPIIDIGIATPLFRYLHVGLQGVIPS